MVETTYQFWMGLLLSEKCQTKTIVILASQQIGWYVYYHQVLWQRTKSGTRCMLFSLFRCICTTGQAHKSNFQQIATETWYFFLEDAWELCIIALRIKNIFTRKPRHTHHSIQYYNEKNMHLQQKPTSRVTPKTTIRWQQQKMIVLWFS